MAILHLSVRSVKSPKSDGLPRRAAAAKYDYLSRSNRWRAKISELEYLESGNMPAWAKDSRHYWSGADAHERANARLAVHLEFSLPREAHVEDQIQIARAYTRELAQTSSGQLLPFSVAVHGNEGNPHCHVMLSERINDGIFREREQWFKRAATGHKSPADGGAKKSQEIHGYQWFQVQRQKLEDILNAWLTKNDYQKVSCKTLEEQGIKRSPQVHLSPVAAAIEKRTNTPTLRGDIWRAHNEIIRAEAALQQLSDTATAMPQAPQALAPAHEPVTPQASQPQAKPKYDYGYLLGEQQQSLAALQGDPAAKEHEAKITAARKALAEAKNQADEAREVMLDLRPQDLKRFEVGGDLHGSWPEIGRGKKWFALSTVTNSYGDALEDQRQASLALQALEYDPGYQDWLAEIENAEAKIAELKQLHSEQWQAERAAMTEADRRIAEDYDRQAAEAAAAAAWTPAREQAWRDEMIQKHGAGQLSPIGYDTDHDSQNLAAPMPMPAPTEGDEPRETRPAAAAHDPEPEPEDEPEASTIHHIIYPSRATYDGEMRDGQRHGQGTLTLVDGRKYEGQWADNRADGLGVWSSPDGHRQEGIYHEGHFVGPAPTDDDELRETRPPSSQGSDQQVSLISSAQPEEAEDGDDDDDDDDSFGPQM